MSGGKSITKGTEDTLIHFLFQIFVQYGLSREIITDGGPQFVAHKIAAPLKYINDQTIPTTNFYNIKPIEIELGKVLNINKNLTDDQQ